MDATIQSLSNTLILEIINAVGLPKTKAAQWVFKLLFHKAADRLAGIGVTFDRLILSDGFSAACTWVLTNWCRNITSRRVGSIPLKGPLLVISNHAGAYDSIVLASLLGRDDLKFIASDVAFLKNLPATSQHFMFISADDAHNRMAGMRVGIRHMQNGGALLLFGTGLIDPDPEVYPGAEAELGNWSPSIDLFLNQVPDANVVVSIVSGIVAPAWAHHPVTWLKRIAWQKRRLAEFGQVIQQLFIPGSLYVSPHVSFSEPVNATELRCASGMDRLLLAVIERGKALLDGHIAWVETNRKE